MSSADNSGKKKVKRLRLGCHRCKKLKSKCSEEKPSCSSCLKLGSQCDYLLKLMWEGRPYKNKENKIKSHLTPKGFREVKPDFAKGPINFVTTQFSPNGKPKVKKESTNKVIVKTEEPDLLEHASHILQSEVLNHSSSLESSNYTYTEDTISTPDATTNEPFVAKPEEMHFSFSPDGSESRLSDLAEVCTNYAEDFVKSNTMMQLDEQAATSPDLLTLQRPMIESPISPDYGRIVELSPESEEPYREEEISASNPSNLITHLLMPLPELLLEVPYYRQLFHFWMTVASSNLVPAPTLYRDNPFKVLLPQMAMHYSGVLTTILAFAARTMQSLNGSNNNEIIDQLLGRSCSALLKQLEDQSEATSDGTLATILLLSSYEVVHSENFEKHRTHTYGAGQIVAARKRKSEDTPTSNSDDDSTSSSVSANSHEESNIAFFLMRWFAYVDVIGALSSTKGREKYLRSYRDSNEYKPVERIAWTEMDFTSDPRREIDYLLGFDARMFPHFVNIALLLDQVDFYMSDPNNNKDCLPQSIIIAALELKDKLTKDHETAEKNRQLIFDEILETNVRAGLMVQKNQHINDLMTKDNTLRCTNRLFFYAGLLNLYRRVLLLPRDLSLVQELVEKMTEILRQFIEPGSPAEICTIFCNFSCGCEVIDSETRMFFVHRFGKLASNGIANASKSLAIMGRCWETGEDWLTAANQLSIDLVLM